MFPIMAIYLSTVLYLRVATKKHKLRLFNSLSKKWQSFWEVAATASQAFLQNLPTQKPHHYESLNMSLAISGVSGHNYGNSMTQKNCH